MPLGLVLYVEIDERNLRYDYIPKEVRGVRVDMKELRIVGLGEDAMYRAGVFELSVR